MPKTVANKFPVDDKSGSGSSPSSPESGVRHRTVATSSGGTTGPKSRPKYVVAKKTISKKQSSKVDVSVTRAVWSATIHKSASPTGTAESESGWYWWILGVFLNDVKQIVIFYDAH